LGTGSLSSGSGTNTTFTITNDTTISWQWKTNYWINFATVGTLNRVSGWFEAGTNLMVIATPDVYSQFDGWFGDTNGASIAGTQLSFTVTGPRVISAAFKDGVTASHAVPYIWLGTVNSVWTNDFEGAATNDWDGDGYTTAQEYWSGTDPTNAASFLHISAVAMSGGMVQLRWLHAWVMDSNVLPICVQTRTNLTGGTWEYAGAVSPVNGTNTWNGAVFPCAFYRLCVTNAP
jgi:hypothetical protein